MSKEEKFKIIAKTLISLQIDFECKITGYRDGTIISFNDENCHFGIVDYDDIKKQFIVSERKEVIQITQNKVK